MKGGDVEGVHGRGGVFVVGAASNINMNDDHIQEVIINHTLLLFIYLMGIGMLCYIFSIY